MRRALLIAGLLSLWLVASTRAQPFPDAGHVCLHLAPFTDILDLHVKHPNGQELWFLFSVDWIATLDGDFEYQLLGSGTAYALPLTPVGGGLPRTVVGLQISVQNDFPEAFGGHRNCRLDGTLDAQTLTGFAQAVCGAFAFESELAPVPCGTVIEALDASAPAWAGPAGLR